MRFERKSRYENWGLVERNGSIKGSNKEGHISGLSISPCIAMQLLKQGKHISGEPPCQRQCYEKKTHHQPLTKLSFWGGSHWNTWANQKKRSLCFGSSYHFWEDYEGGYEVSVIDMIATRSTLLCWHTRGLWPAALKITDRNGASAGKKHLRTPQSLISRHTVNRQQRIKRRE